MMKGKLFEIVIQLAAILAVCWEYRLRLWHVIATLPSEGKARRFAVNIALAFLPAALIGVVLSNTIKRYLFAAVPVPTAFIAGGVLILWIDSRKRIERVAMVDDVKPPDAIWVGFAQVIAAAMRRMRRPDAAHSAG
jgi:undecaprenyl-diphosphatase